MNADNLLQRKLPNFLKVMTDLQNLLFFALILNTQKECEQNWLTPIPIYSRRTINM